jgi:hypothetical protein
MQVQMVENWSQIEGELRSWDPRSDVAGFGIAEILVDRVEAVSHFPNLLHDAGGRVLRVLVPSESATAVAPAAGLRVSSRVRRGGPDRIYAHPDHFIVVPR